jgi:hypothetical protein
MITVICKSCNEEFDIPDSLAGADQTCPKCGSHIAAPASTKGNPFWRMPKKKIIVGAVAIGVIIVGCCAWLFWPSRHSANITGGAWSLKNNGTSDLLRGMNVYLLRAECSGTSVRQCYQAIAALVKQGAADARKQCQDDAARARKQGQDLAEISRKSAKRARAEKDDFGIWKKVAEDAEARAKETLEEAEAEAKKTIDEAEAGAKVKDNYAASIIAESTKLPDRMSVGDAYQAIRRVADSRPGGKRSPLLGYFADVRKGCLHATAQVNIDGKFSFETVPSGKYYLYAMWSTEFSSVEWLVPVDVKGSGPVSQDLFNDTAAVIE